MAIHFVLVRAVLGILPNVHNRSLFSRHQSGPTRHLDKHVTYTHTLYVHSHVEHSSGGKTAYPNVLQDRLDQKGESGAEPRLDQKGESGAQPRLGHKGDSATARK